MKKLMIASAIAMTMAAGSAIAADGEVQFFGTVTSATCDVVPEVGGSVSNLIQLGTTKPSTPGKDVLFSLKAKDASGQGDCATVNTAHVSWSGNLTAQGIANAGGTATDAWVKLTPVNDSGSGAQPITSSHTTSDFTGAAALLKGDGLQYKAQLQGGTTPGDFRSASAFVVSYE